MKKTVFILLFLLLGASVKSQDIRSLFMSAPDDVLPLLSQDARADFLDYADAGMVVGVTNRLDGVSFMTELTDDYIALKTTNSSTMQIKMLPLEDGGHILAVVKSVKAEAENSHVEFYDLDWKKLPGADFFEVPAIEDFFISPDSAVKYVDKCDMYLVKYSLTGNDTVLLTEYTMLSYMNIDDGKLLAPLMRNVVYRWNGRRFVRE